MTNTVTKIIKNWTEYDIYAIAWWGTTETATSTTEWVVKLGSDTVQSVTANNPSSTASRTYPVQLNADSQAVVNIPRTDTNTTYTASDFDIKDLTDSTSLRATWSNKQDALSTQTAYTSKWSATKVPQITTNTLWQVTWITEVTITQPTVNNATLTIQKNGSDVQTFTANASSNVTANIQVNEVPSTWTTGHVLTKTASWYEFAAPSWWINNVTTWTTSTVTWIWAGSETEYWNLSSTSDSVLYFTF